MPPYKDYISCCFCGAWIEETEDAVEGKIAIICSKCISTSEKTLVRGILGDEAEKYPLFANCFRHEAVRSIFETDKLGLGNPAFIMPKLEGKEFNSFADFLNFILVEMEKQVASASSPPEGFEKGLVHALHEGMPLCEFSQNVRYLWPQDQFSTTPEVNFSGMNCLQCEFIARERFPQHPAFAS